MQYPEEETETNVTPRETSAYAVDSGDDVGCSPGRNCPIGVLRCDGTCLYARIFETISVAMIGMDTSLGRVFYQNRSACEIFQDTLKPFDFQGLYDLLIKEIHDDFENVPGSEISRRLRLGLRIIGYTAYKVEKGTFWIYLRDVTERERLCSIAEATTIMNNTGYIFSGVRHELGNPINAVKMTLHLLKRNGRSAAPEKIEEYVDRALAEIERAEYLLKALKNFNMYENPNPDEVDVREFIKRLAAVAARDLRSRGIEFSIRIDPDLKTAWFDPRALKQVMINLITNAMDALNDTTTPRLTLQLTSGPDRAIITVSDNGSGMDEEARERVFQPFITTKPDGTGLGMAIARKLIVGMAGTIELESAVGRGTTVTITLPLRSPSRG